MKPIKVGKAKRAHLESFRVGTAAKTRLCPPLSSRYDSNLGNAVLAWQAGI